MKPAAHPETESAAPAIIRFRALLTSALLVLIASYATVHLPQSSMFSLLAVPMAILIALLCLNEIWFLTFRKRSYSKAELATFFGVSSVASAVSAEWVEIAAGQAHILPILSEGNPDLKQKVMEPLPGWLIAKDNSTFRDITSAHSTPDSALSAWPTIAPQHVVWTLLIASAALACLAFVSLLRQLWCEKERLAFPILQLPAAMLSSDSKSMWRSRLMWGAFIVIFSIDLLNGFQYWFPSLPKIPVKQLIDTSPFLVSAPWNSMGELRVGIYPFLAAMAIFIPNDLLASMLGFFFVRKLTHIVLGTMGIPQGTFAGTSLAPGPPYFEEQTWGGILALFVSLMWVGRHWIRGIFADIRSGAVAEDGGWKHRSSFLLLAISAVVFVGLGVAAGAQIHILALTFALFLIMSVSITRIRAQLGPPTHEFAFMGPNSLINRLIGNANLSESSLLWNHYVLAFVNRISRTHPMPHQLEAMKLIRMQGGSMKRVITLLAFCTIAAVFFAIFFHWIRAYRLGAAIPSFTGVGAVQQAVANPGGPDPMAMGMTAFGFLFVAGLELVRFRFPAFPIHPVGYIMGVSYSIDAYWFGLALALGIKVFVQRYYGRNGYEQLRMAALGILLAEFAAEAIWMTITLTTGQSTITIGFDDRSLGNQ